MKRSRTGSSAGEVLASAPLATVQLPVPLLDVLADTRTAFFGRCLDARQQVLRTMMEQDREQLCGPRNVPHPARRAYRHGQAPGEVTLGARRILPWLRARSIDGHELALPSFTYAAGRDPLNARTLEAIAIGVTSRKYRRALDPLPGRCPGWRACFFGSAAGSPGFQLAPERQPACCTVDQEFWMEPSRSQFDFSDTCRGICPPLADMRINVRRLQALRAAGRRDDGDGVGPGVRRHRESLLERGPAGRDAPTEGPGAGVPLLHPSA